MTTPTESTSPTWRIPIGALLLFGFGGLVGVAVSIALYLGIDSARENTRELLKENLETLVHDLTGQVDRHLTPVLEQARWLTRQVDTGLVDPEDSVLFDTLARGALAATPQVRHAEIHLDSGVTRRISRDTPGDTEAEVPTESVGPEVTDARPDTLEPAWQQPTFDPVTDEFVIRLVTPLVSKQNRLAIMIHVVPLSSIARHLNDLLDETGLTPFILYNWQWVLAHPMLIGQSWKEDDATILLPRLDGLGDGVLASIWDTDQESPTIVAPSDYIRTSLIELGEQHYAFTYRSFVGFGEAPWTIGVYRRVELEDSVLGRIVWAGVVGVIILAISVVAAVGIGHLTSNPIRQLEEGARKVRTSGFSDVEPLRPSRILEIDETVKSFNQMVDGLRERERIRDLFGKYVPSRIAERLLSHDEDLAPHSSEATILFVDLADFSSLTERLGPSGTVTLLNEYFELAVSTLEKYGAIVTQFQGDAILATFNVPVPQPGHATLAIDAGIELLEGVAERRFSGQRLRCRIGISTGPVISGNVGAPGRLNYTVHGDAVNLAARLEELNKTYGRHLLVSAATVSRAEDRGLIKIDTVSIRGRYQQVEIYGLKDDTVSTTLPT